MDLLTVLPNLSIGVVSILALVFITRSFLIHLKEERAQERQERTENQVAFRELEQEIRGSIMGQLGENTKAFERVMEHLKKHD